MLVATLFPLGACANSGGDGPAIAFLMPESETLRYDAKDRPAFIAKVKDLCPDCKVIYSNADGDPAKQQQQAEAALTNGAAVLVLDPADSASAAVIARRAKAAGVPVIAYDRLVENAPVDYYVSFDNEKVGELQGQGIVDVLSAKGMPNGRVVMLNGDPKTATARQFKTGAEKALHASAVQIVKSFDTPDWSPSNAQREMDQAIAILGPAGFDAVYAGNDDLAGGAVAAMKSAGIDPSTRPLVGQDATLAGVQRIVDGEQYLTIYKAIPLEANAAAQLAVGLTKGQKPDGATLNGTINNGAGDVPAILLDPVAVTQKDLRDTVIDDGYWSVGDICTEGYVQACSTLGIK